MGWKRIIGQRENQNIKKNSEKIKMEEWKAYGGREIEDRGRKNRWWERGEIEGEYAWESSFFE